MTIYNVLGCLSFWLCLPSFMSGQCNLLNQEPSVLINEIGNTVRNTNAEFVELVALGALNDAQSSINLNGWIVDDNNNTRSEVGNEPGHIRLGPCFTQLPPGSMILIYNSERHIPGIDPSNDGLPNNQGVYQVPLNSSCLTKVPRCPSSNNSAYNCAIPLGQSTINNQSNLWNNYLPMRNLGDALQVRKPSGEVVHALFWEIDFLGAGVNIPVLGGSVANQSISFQGTNWHDAEQYLVSEIGTPGEPNSGSNRELLRSIVEGSIPSSFDINCNIISVEIEEPSVTGQVEIIMSGGSPPYNIKIDGPIVSGESFLSTFRSSDSHYFLTQLNVGRFNIEVTDDTGCTATCSVELGSVVDPPSTQVYSGDIDSEPVCEVNLNCWVDTELPNILVDLFNEIIPQDLLPPCLNPNDDPSTCTDCEICPEQCDLFAEEIYYKQEDQSLETTPMYAGNISHTKWMTSYGAHPQSYTYSYDDNDRLLTARSGSYGPSRPGWADDSWSLNTNYDVALGYDGAGNILNINRNGVTSRSSNGIMNFGGIDNLGLTYGNSNAPNQLTSISETNDQEFLIKGFKPYGGSMPSSQIEYDPNGNMIKNDYKGITKITYDLYNYPTIIEFMDRSTIEMDYDANGNKLWMEVSKAGQAPKEFAYLDGMVVSSRGESLYADGGRLTDESGDFRAEYTISDHLGNGRVWFSDLNEDGRISCDHTEVLQEEHYYPFGMAQEGVWQNYPNNPDDEFYPPVPGDQNDNFKYNGLETEDDLTGWIFYKFRAYDPSVGRFMSADPIADQFAWVSPYNYAENKPVNGVDLWGLQYFPADQLKHRVASFFNNLFGTNIQTTGRQKPNPVRHGKFDVKIEGHGKVGMGLGVKGSAFGLKGKVNVDVGSVRVVEGSIGTDGVTGNISDSENSTVERDLSLSISATDQVSLGAGYEQKLITENGEQTETEEVKVGLTVGETTYGLSGGGETGDKSDVRTYSFSLGFGAQIIFGGEAKIKFQLKTSTDKSKL